MKKYISIVSLVLFLAIGVSSYAFGEKGPGVINLNTATLTDLHMLDGMTSQLAQNIIAYRDANGPFASVNDLINVKGITKAKLREFKPFLVLEGDTDYDISEASHGAR
jgi:competence protein ComEA